MKNLKNSIKLVIVVPDGMTDLPVPELGGKTPLEVAKTPNMDFILKNGVAGIVWNVPSDMEPGSDVANLSILGVNPKKIDIGRGALEALAKDIKLKNNEYVFRANFVTIEDNVMKDYTGGNIKTEYAEKLIDYLNKKIDKNVKFFPGVDYRNLAIIKTEKKINVKTTPPHNIIDKEIFSFLPKGKYSELVKDIMFESYNLLSKLKNKRVSANMVWLWGEGKVNGKVESFEKRYGIKGAVITAVDIIKGIAKLLKMEILDVPGITGDLNTSYKNEAIYALKNLKDYDCIYLHIEAPDEAGHQGNYKEKIKSIEKIDKLVLGTLLKKKDDIYILLLPDHPTSISQRKHINSPVPFILYGKDIRANNNFEKFSEKILNECTLKIKEGDKLLDWVLSKIVNKI